jgi:hypothetical protein
MNPILLTLSITLILSPSLQAQTPKWAKPPEDPVRIIDGKTLSVTSSNWAAFHGKILEVQPGGIRVDGYYEGLDGSFFSGEFFVAHFPYAVAENDGIGWEHLYVALPDGVYSYRAIVGSHTIRKLEYGEVWKAPAPTPQKPATAEQIATAKAAADKRKSDLAAATFRFHLQKAQAGEASSQFRLYQLYTAGEGVEKDPDQARAWLSKAAAQGHREALAALAQLHR